MDLSFNFGIQTNSIYLKMFAMKLTKNRDDADDLYQETVFRALKNSTKFIPGSNIKAWLTTIMKNSFINNYRRKKRDQIIPDATLHAYILETNAGKDRNLGESNVTLEEINMIIEELDTDLKVPFMLIWQGYKYEEVADQLGLPLGTVKSRIFQARKQLQHQIKTLFNIERSKEIVL